MKDVEIVRAIFRKSVDTSGFATASSVPLARPNRSADVGNMQAVPDPVPSGAECDQR
jgi:hypothetical protein